MMPVCPLLIIVGKLGEVGVLCREVSRRCGFVRLMGRTADRPSENHHPGWLCTRGGRLRSLDAHQQVELYCSACRLRSYRRCGLWLGPQHWCVAFAGS